MEATMIPTISTCNPSYQNMSLNGKISRMSVKVKKMSKKISRIGFVASMLSVALSLYIYFVSGEKELGIFVGLWAPTLILASKEIEEILEK